MATSPYQGRPVTSFWRNGVAQWAPGLPPDLYTRKWPIQRSDRIATAGSCFAQHIGRNLKIQGYNVLDVEPPPQGLVPSDHAAYGYSTYSARYGNIYTTRQLLQLAAEAFGDWSPRDVVWQRDDSGYVDSLRPGVEPQGLESPAEVIEHRKLHIRRVRNMLEATDVLVFTLGLTEAWIHRASGTVFPTAPGTLAGKYDEDLYAFHNFRHAEVVADFLALRELVHSHQAKKCRFLLTVSPVPLTATATSKHVLVATTNSKSVLRAAAGELEADHEDIDYFPSYEIVANPWNVTPSYEDNLRTVRQCAVDRVMQAFTTAHAGPKASLAFSTPTTLQAAPARPPASLESLADVACEEALLEAFAKDAR